MFSWRQFFIMPEQVYTINIQMSLNLNILWLLRMRLKNIKLLQCSHAASAEMTADGTLTALVTVTHMVAYICSWVWILKANIIMRSQQRSNASCLKAWCVLSNLGPAGQSRYLRYNRSGRRLTTSATPFCSLHCFIVVICSFGHLYSHMHH